MSDKNIKSLGDTMTNMKAVTDELRERKSIIADAQKAVRCRRCGGSGPRAGQIEQHPGQRRRQARDRQAGRRGHRDRRRRQGRARLVDNLKGPTTRFATDGLPQLSDAIVSLQKATEHLDEIAGEVRNDPRGLLSKPPAKQVEVKP